MSIIYILMPRFAKGSDEAREHMANVRSARRAKGEGIINNIKKGIETGIAKTTEYLGAVVKGRGSIYPPKVRRILAKVVDKKVVAAELRRSPVQTLLTKAMDVITLGQFSKNMSKTPYDKLFHLQIVLTLDTGAKLLVEKNEVINMDMGGLPLKKGTEVLQITPITAVLLNDALEKTKTKMGANNYFDYNAENNNCQDFIAALMTANNWGDANDFAFVKQDTQALFKGLSGLAKTAYTLTELGERANVAMTGKGSGEGLGDEFDKLTVKQLRKMLSQFNKNRIITGYSKMNRQTLIMTVRTHFILKDGKLLEKGTVKRRIGPTLVSTETITSLPTASVGTKGQQRYNKAVETVENRFKDTQGVDVRPSLGFGLRRQKGSPEAKEYMKMLRDKRKKH